MDSTKLVQQDQAVPLQAPKELVTLSKVALSTVDSSIESKHISNIKGLSFEVLACVFKLYVDVTFGPWTMSKAPFILGAVCRTWRDIAWTTPALWTTLYFKSEQTTTKGHVQLATEWISRSGAMPFSVSVVAPGPGVDPKQEQLAFPLIDMINKSLHRCRSLELSLLPSLIFSRFAPLGGPSMLHSLCINATRFSTPIDLGSAAPTELDIVNVPFDSLVLNWMNITTFRAFDLSVDEIIQALTLAPLINMCHQSLVQSLYTRLEGNKPYIHSKLQDLYVTFEDIDAASDFFQHMSFPSMTSFYVASDLMLPARTFFGFLARSSSSITDLNLHEGSISANELVEIATILPSIRVLTIYFCLDSNQAPEALNPFYNALCLDSRYRTISPSDAVLLPMLQRLDITASYWFPWASIPGLWYHRRYEGNRRTISPGRPDLKVIKIQSVYHKANNSVVNTASAGNKEGREHYPKGLIDSWDTFSELLELRRSANMELDLGVKAGRSKSTDLFKLSYEKLGQCVGKAPESI